MGGGPKQGRLKSSTERFDAETSGRFWASMTKALPLELEVLPGSFSIYRAVNYGINVSYSTYWGYDRHGRHRHYCHHRPPATTIPSRR